MLKEKIISYLDTSGISRALFCKRIGITPQHLYNYLNKGAAFSDELEDKIRDYLSVYDINSR